MRNGGIRPTVHVAHLVTDWATVKEDLSSIDAAVGADMDLPTVFSQSVHLGACDGVLVLDLDSTNNLSDGTLRYSNPELYVNHGYVNFTVRYNVLAVTNGDESLFRLEVKPVSFNK